MSTRIERIAPRVVEENFQDCAQWLSRAVARCKDEALEDVRLDCVTGRAQLWFAYLDDRLSGVFVTEIRQHRARRVLELRYLAGMPVRQWLSLQSVLVTWAKQHGCDAIRIRGRRGWLRVLPSSGWQPTSYEMELGT